MSVGDRREFLVDFSGIPSGDTVYMINVPITQGIDYYYGKTPGKAFMAFIMEDTISPVDPINAIPVTLKPYVLSPGTVDRSRTKRLMIGAPPPGNTTGGPWTIDGDTMNMSIINDTIMVNTKESWTIINETTKAHPFHIHKVQFQIVEYTGMLDFNDNVETYTYPNLPDELIGYKDVQLLREGATMTFEARFDFYPSALEDTNGYMYHCHILTHEDASMMHQFVVVDSATFLAEITPIPGTQSLVVYPNPAENTISFKGAEDQSGTLRLYDLQGVLLDEIEIASLGSTTLDVVDLPRGVLILEFTSGENRYVEKVILK
jgi:bilirubin oxidase